MKSKFGWKRQAQCTTGLCGANQKKIELNGKNSFSEIERGEEPKKVHQTECTSLEKHMIQVMFEAGHYQNGIERGSRSMLGSQRPHCTTRKIQVFWILARASGQKKGCQVRLTGIGNIGLAQRSADQEVTASEVLCVCCFVL